MKIASWNINSVRLRIKQVEEFTRLHNPDILCLQETKVVDESFPVKAIKKIGYEHILFRGEKSYNGVAILSKIPLAGVDKQNMAGSFDSRHISTMLPDGIELHNFYIPAGGDEPDVNINPKYKFKLDFVDYMNRWFTSNRKKTDKIIILGDFNIAPMEHDVWSSRQLRNVVSHTEPERVGLDRFRETFGWIDTARHFIPDNEKSYSWWSYRNRDWKKSDRGRRLDHIWTTSPLKDRLLSYNVVTQTRDWEKPSDHAPIILQL
ncbi:MAG: exodeoxyribonuclease III [Rickettsiales bacterium]|nr:exodeoxyribonuclease III [Pseudomonadota bacterium]MDA0966012.1 exodeoxyribonuclease III [Pseudomonadota bacterium]MDG4542517.1 exodeoxyribonuclease III [Rickettsiales bacterium]MDG4545021.1 exodeoxyribonuclease III [Rickettsiales bacterium]MDG4547144.1 exodeoxyribonuclease III [Rickettsiales bacterium]